MTASSTNATQSANVRQLLPPSLMSMIWLRMSSALSLSATTAARAIRLTQSSEFVANAPAGSPSSVP